jgi:hypothetical protein
MAVLQQGISGRYGFQYFGFMPVMSYMMSRSSGRRFHERLLVGKSREGPLGKSDTSQTECTIITVGGIEKEKIGERSCADLQSIPPQPVDAARPVSGRACQEGKKSRSGGDPVNALEAAASKDSGKRAFGQKTGTASLENS